MCIRDSSRQALSSVKEWPSTLISPSSCDSSRFIHLTRVDLPDPEGPHITTFCPFKTFKLTLSSALNFPKYLDRQNKVERKHDFVFVRDLFISDQKSKIIISSFSEKERQIESDVMQEMLESMNYNTLRIPEKNNAKAEGGEFYYCKGSNLLFSGCCRNNRAGAERIAKEVDV